MIYVCLFDEGAAGANALSAHTSKKSAEEAITIYKKESPRLANDFVIEEFIDNKLSDLWAYEYLKTSKQ